MSQAGIDWIMKETEPIPSNIGGDNPGEKNGVNPTQIVSPIISLLTALMAIKFFLISC